MADVKWIKITTDIFDDEKILLIESMPEADSIIVIWFKLLCLAGKMNNSGVFMMNDRIAYTDKMLATIFRRKESTVALALKTFEEFGMIELVDDVITIPNWGRHQSLDKIEKKTEYMREYMQEYRKNQKKKIGIGKYNAAGLSAEDWKSVLDEFDYQCAYCGSKEEIEQEHFVPTNKGGKFEIGNIIPACRRCNASKGTKDGFEWYAEQDFFDEERCKHLRKYLRKSNIGHLRKANVSRLDIEEDIEGEKEEERDITEPAPKPVKHRFGEYKNVLLTDEELEKLKAEIPNTEDMIERLSGYIASTGKRYKSHYATIRNWSRNDHSNTTTAKQTKAQELDDFYNMAANWANTEE